MGRASREVWIKRIERWRESGVGAKEFAQQVGVEVDTPAEDRDDPIIEVVAPSGFCIRVPARFDVDTLRRSMSARSAVSSSTVGRDEDTPAR